MKIAIFGYSGSGKSTLAQNLGKKLNIPVLHLDKVQFLPDWEERSLFEGLEIVKGFMDNESWIIDGNYPKFCFDIRMAEADKIVFLNFSRFNCFCRALRRYSLNKGKVRSDMSEGCFEKFDFEFAWWILYEGRKANTAKYFGVLSRYKDKVFVVNNQRQLDNLLRDFPY